MNCHLVSEVIFSFSPNWRDNVSREGKEEGFGFRNFFSLQIRFELGRYGG